MKPNLIRSHPQKVLWPDIIVGLSFPILDLLEYASGSILDLASISGKNPHFDIVYRKEATDESTSRQGFTLLEVLFAMVIFAVGILALTGLQITTVGGNGRACVQTEATAIGVRLLEHLRSLPFDHDELTATVVPRRMAAGSHRPYRVSWMVTDDAPLNGTKTVRVTVTPTNTVTGRPVTITTIIAK